jgi:peptide deformylase
MHIIVAPNPILRAKSEPVAPAEIRRLRSTARQMAKLMYKSQGCGLAAPQVGLGKRLLVIDITPPDEDGKVTEKDPTFFINPVVKRLWGEQKVSDEGCLSIPGIQIPLERFNNIEVEALDLDGEPFTLEAEGFYARALQHELDHLEGMTMFERLDPLERIEAFREYEAALEAGAKPGDTSVGDANATEGKDAGAAARGARGARGARTSTAAQTARGAAAERAGGKSS